MTASFSRDPKGSALCRKTIEMSGLNAIEMSSLPRPRRNHVYRRAYPRPDTPEPERTRCPQDHARRPQRPTHARRRRPHPPPAWTALQPSARPTTAAGRPGRLPPTLRRFWPYLRQREAGPRGTIRPTPDVASLVDRRRLVAAATPPRPASPSSPAPVLLRRVSADGCLRT